MQKLLTGVATAALALALAPAARAQVNINIGTPVLGAPVRVNPNGKPHPHGMPPGQAKKMYRSGGGVVIAPGGVLVGQPGRGKGKFKNKGWR